VNVEREAGRAASSGAAPDAARLAETVVVEELDDRAPAAAAIRRAIAVSVRELLRNDPVVREDTDPEGVHHARVATRRLRSDLRTFGPLLDRDWSADLRDELGWLGASLGGARDVDVLLGRMRERIAELDAADPGGGDPIVASLMERDRAAHDAVIEAIQSERYALLLERLLMAASDPALLPEAERAAVDALPGLARRPWKKLRASVRAAGKDPSDGVLHAIRIRAKRARYAAEAVAPVVGPKASAFAVAVSSLQGVLGEHQDAVVAETWLHGWAAGQVSRRAAFVAGEIAALERAAARKARKRWPKEWRRLDRPSLRSWM
jgi:CHAD domain-containing protein